MALNLTNYVRQISKEKDLEPEVIKEAIEQALVAASKKNLSQFKNARASLDLTTGQLDFVAAKEVVKKVENPRLEVDLRSARKIRADVQIGDEIEVIIEPAQLGRIAAQSAKQVVIQKLRDAEREKIYEEYKERVGQVLTGIVQRFERRDAIVNLGRADGVLTLQHQPYGVRYRVGDRLKVLLVEIEKTARGPAIRVSRTEPELVIRLFEQEVPEVADGTVKIVAIAREPGTRTKVGVTSNNPDVDPVGACVGMKGSRVQMIVREFENEKIDIVPFSPTPATFITSALNPAKIVRVDCDDDTGEADVLVARGNLSLAIGKRGQNARLAARLTGWKINIRGEEETEAEAEAEELRRRYLEDLLRQIPDLTDEQREAIGKSEMNSIENLAEAEVASVAGLVDGNEDLAGQIIAGAEEYLEALVEMAEGEETVAEEEAEGEEQPGPVSEDSVETLDEEETVPADETEEADETRSAAEKSPGGEASEDEEEEIPAEEEPETVAAGEEIDAEEAPGPEAGEEEPRETAGPAEAAETEETEPETAAPEPAAEEDEEEKPS